MLVRAGSISDGSWLNTCKHVPVHRRYIPATTHTHTHNSITALWILSGTNRVSRYQNIHPLTPRVVINRPLSASFIRIPFLPPKQQHQSTEGKSSCLSYPCINHVMQILLSLPPVYHKYLCIFYKNCLL